MFTESRTFIIAELSQTHEGSLPLAKMLVKAASIAKADAVKVQMSLLCSPTNITHFSNSLNGLRSPGKN